MVKINIERLRQDVQIGNFDCENPSINGQIEESYFPTLLQYAYAYRVSVDGRVVAYYMIKFKTIHMDIAPDELAEYTSSVVNDCSAIHIKYIAVDKVCKKQGIGTYILKTIVAQALRLCQQFPISLVTLDALTDKYEWYKKRGFKAFSEDELQKNEPTIQMYINCILNKEAVNNYSVI